MFNELHYCQIVKNDKDRSWNMFISTKLKKIKRFYLFILFTYLFSFERGRKYPPILIHQKVFNDLYTTSKKFKLFEIENRNCE